MSVGIKIKKSGISDEVDTLRQGTLAGMAEGDLKQYSDRKRQVRELQMVLKHLRTRPS